MSGAQLTEQAATDDSMSAGAYEPPMVIMAGSFGADTAGSYRVGRSDNGDAGAYWS